jgi:hypothetical protein
MHPTRDTQAFINLKLVGGRVMPGVMLLNPKLEVLSHREG